MVRKCSWGGMLVILLLTLSLMAFTQESTVKGNLSGIVADSSGAVVPDAKVTINGPTGSRTLTTGQDGRFFWGPLTPGTYSVTVERQGFRKAELKSAEISTGRTTTVSITLQPGSVTEIVEVTASAVTVDTASSAVSQNLNDSFYSNMPIARNVTSLFYASPGVTSGGGTGAANPSISGGSGLENQYVADGVNITDAAFGGIGVFSGLYGALSTGINLSFVKEVQVKTGGFEPQYGKSTGGIVQIVTKSGSNAYHGGVSGFFGPQQLEAQRLNPDDPGFGRLNQQGPLNHTQGYDVSGELGGYVPGMKDRLFFFGSFNPSWNTEFHHLTDLHGVYNFPLVGAPSDLKTTAYNYAAKLTLRLSDKHVVESSVYGDPTRSNTGAYTTSSTYSDTTFSKLSFGGRNWVARYNGTLSPTWLFNASMSWGHNYLDEQLKSPEVFQIADQTGCGFTGTTGSSSCRTPITPGTLNGPLGPLAGQFTRQGHGFFMVNEGDNWGLSFDTQKIVNKLGSHSFSVGYHYERNFYKGNRDYMLPGFGFTITPAMAAGMGLPTTAGLQSSAAFQLRVISPVSGTCGGDGVSVAGTRCPTMFVPGAGVKNVYLLQVRGIFDNHGFDTDGNYHAAYVNDAWTINKHITVNFGYRWEQQRLQGTPYNNFETGEAFHTHYTFTDNWSPRIGLSIDPVGDRKTKVYGNFARYSYAIPLDMAIRSLSNELDFPTTGWAPVSSGGSVVVNSDGTLPNPVLDDAHLLAFLSGASLSSTTSIAHGTKMQYLQEWVAGLQHEFPKGIVVDIRWIDRRMKRAVEDIGGLSPEAYQCCLNQNYIISNPSPSTDLFVNPIQVRYPVGGLPASCTGAAAGGTISDFAGNDVGDLCITNAFTNATGTTQLAAQLGPDGIPDGFVNPVRKYKAIEFEVNKAFSAGWQMRFNYRWSNLSGNYEGAFRNDNGQADPSISSLFDFTRGDFNLLGNQFDPGWLNTDRHHIFNGFVSYAFTGGFLKNLTLGTGVRIETGIPINRLRAHPAYQNAGEIPEGGRGFLGRTPSDGQADVHAEYALKLNEKHAIHFGADLFNITNQKQQLRVDQNVDRSFLVANADFLKPTQTTGYNPQLGFQAPFRARLFAKWVF